MRDPPPAPHVVSGARPVSVVLPARDVGGDRGAVRSRAPLLHGAPTVPCAPSARARPCAGLAARVVGGSSTPPTGGPSRPTHPSPARGWGRGFMTRCYTACDDFQWGGPGVCASPSPLSMQTQLKSRFVGTCHGGGFATAAASWQRRQRRWRRRRLRRQLQRWRNLRPACRTLSAPVPCVREAVHIAFCARSGPGREGGHCWRTVQCRGTRLALPPAIGGSSQRFVGRILHCTYILYSWPTLRIMAPPPPVHAQG